LGDNELMKSNADMPDWSALGQGCAAKLSSLLYIVLAQGLLLWDMDAFVHAVGSFSVYCILYTTVKGALFSIHQSGKNSGTPHVPSSISRKTASSHSLDITLKGLA
jgi:hypothetical protein